MEPLVISESILWAVTGAAMCCKQFTDLTFGEMEADILRQRIVKHLLLHIFVIPEFVS